MKRIVSAVSGMVVIFALIAGCGKSPVMQYGKQVNIFVVADRGIKSGMTEDERNDRNEVAEFMEKDLAKKLKHEGYLATPIQDRSRYIEGDVNYLVAVRIDMLRLVGGASRYWLGYAPGPTILHIQCEAVGPNKKQLFNYTDEDSTIRDWQLSPRELNERLVNRINDVIIGKSK